MQPGRFFSKTASGRGAISRYTTNLKEKHKGLGAENIASFDLYRKLRHSVAYGLDTVVGKDDAKEAILFAEEFLNKVKAYLKY